MPFFFMRVFAPFAFAYVLSYGLRTVNAIIAPQLTSDLSLTAASLGFLTAAYFLAFAAVQVPLGIWLDRHRPRAVEAALLLVAAAGALLFALANDLWLLVIARALIGAGVCCCLMASLRTFGQWLPKERLPLVNGLQLAMGSVGAIAATAPAQSLLPLMGWRGMFFALCAMLVIGSLWLWFATPDPKSAETPLPAAQKAAISSEKNSKFSAWKSPVFWTLMPFAALNSAHGMSVQALWASPWLLDVVGTPRATLGTTLVMVSVGMLVGNLLSGSLATAFAKRGVLPHQVGVVLCALAVLTQLPLVLGTTTSPRLFLFLFGVFNCAGNVIFAGANHFFATNVLGRVYTAFNLSMFVIAFSLQWFTGVIVNAFPKAGGGYTSRGYEIAFGLVVALQIAALVWYFVRRKTLHLPTQS